MLKNFFKVAIRHIIKNKLYSVINVLGFALGLYVCLIIGFYVFDDIVFDRYHDQGEYIYRVVSFDNTRNWISAVTSGPMMLKFKEDIPEIAASTRLSWQFTRLQPGSIDPATDSLAVFKRVYITGSGFFDVFDFEIIRGNSENPLEDLKGIYLTEETAEILYGQEDPIDQPVNIPFLEDAYVAGIVESPPRTSHIQFDAILPMDIRLNPVWWNSWENLALTGYIKIRDDADPVEVGKKIILSSREGGFSEVFTPQMQPIREMHLGSQDIRYDAVNYGKSSKSVVYGLIMIGILILLVATINFVNLSSARASRRAREVGVRKVVGARKIHLSQQFFVESIILTLLAMIIAIGILEITSPLLGTFLERSFNIGALHNPLYLLMLLSSAMFVGLLSGIYPAFVISNFKSVDVLKGEVNSGRKGTSIRRFFVISQFAVSIGLIIGVLIVLQQVRYLQKVDFGYDRDQVYVIPAFDNRITTGNDTFRQQVEQLPEIDFFGRISTMPGQTLPTTEVCFDFRDIEIGSMFDEIHIDDGLIPTLGVEMIQGRNFSKDFPSDTSAVIINETAYRMSGWDGIEGHQVVIRGADEQDVTWDVIGVINDINFGMAQRVIEPMVIKYDPVRSALALVKVNQNDLDVTEEKVEEIYQEVFPEREFRAFSFDNIFSRQFSDETDFASKIAVFAFLAIIIASLGLFGLASYTTEQRRREIALRKVLGSSIKRIVILLVSDFCRLVIIANVIAWPLAWFVMNSWLQNFAYRTRIDLFYFFIAGMTALVIAIFTVGLRTIKAAYLNPAKTLKYE